MHVRLWKPIYFYLGPGKRFCQHGYLCSCAVNWAVKLQNLHPATDTSLQGHIPPSHRSSIFGGFYRKMRNSERAGWYLALLQPLLAVTQGFGCFIKGFSSKVNINHPVGRFSLSVSLWLFSVRDKEMRRGCRQAKGRVRRNKIPYLMHA